MFRLTTKLSAIYFLLATSIFAEIPLTYEGKSNPHNHGIRLDWDCSECHSAEAVNEQIHSMMNVNTDNPDISIPENFPLTQDKVMTCSTCHLETEKRNRSNAAFLRGGPYRRELDFCYNCHSAKKYKKMNPHQQLREDGSINSGVCLNCHSKTPSATDHPTIAAEMNTEMKTTCNKCHALHTHEQAHYGKNLIDSKKATLKQYKATLKRLDIILPLSRKNEIQCNTCHYIHGSLGIDAVIYDGSEDNEHFLRLPRERLCYACHNL